MRIDPTTQFALNGGEVSERHRVVNNRPGDWAFCPLVRVTPAIQALAARKSSDQARERGSLGPIESSWRTFWDTLEAEDA